LGTATECFLIPKCSSVIIDQTLKDKSVFLEHFLLFLLPSLITHGSIPSNEDDLLIFAIWLNQAFFLKLSLFLFPLLDKPSDFLFEILQQAPRTARAFQRGAEF